MTTERTSARVYPSCPRLLPDGSGMVCDQCEQQWDPGKGEGPICVQCAVAWVEIESRAQP